MTEDTPILKEDAARDRQRIPAEKSTFRQINLRRTLAA
jgi:hypothetical protein